MGQKRPFPVVKSCFWREPKMALSHSQRSFSTPVVNPLTPARVKFAWSHRAQKCAFLAFYAKFWNVPHKKFFWKIFIWCKNQFYFGWCYSRISQVYKSAVIWQLFKFNSLFFSKKSFFAHRFWFPGWSWFSYLNNCITI